MYLNIGQRQQIIGQEAADRPGDTGDKDAGWHREPFQKLSANCENRLNGLCRFIVINAPTYIAITANYCTATCAMLQLPQQPPNARIRHPESIDNNPPTARA